MHACLQARVRACAWVGGWLQIAEVKRKAEVQRERLEGLRVSLLKRKDLLRSTAAERLLRYQAKRAQLGDNNMSVALEKEETKLRRLLTEQYEKDDFIKTKESETNYKSLSLQLGQLADELNGVVKRAALM